MIEPLHLPSGERKYGHLPSSYLFRFCFFTHESDFFFPLLSSAILLAALHHRYYQYVKVQMFTHTNNPLSLMLAHHSCIPVFPFKIITIISADYFIIIVNNRGKNQEVGWWGLLKSLIGRLIGRLLGGQLLCSPSDGGVSTLTLRSMVRTVGEVCFQDEGHGVIDEEISTCIRYSSSSFHSSSLSLFIIVWFACAPPTIGAPSFCIFFLYAVISCEKKISHLY